MNIDRETCEKYNGKWYDHDEYYGKNVCVGIDLENANLPEANLSNSNLKYANLSHSDLWDAYLSSSNLSYSDLSNSDLKAVKLNEKSVKSLLEINPHYLETTEEQVKKNRELIKQELLLSGV